MQPKVSVIIPVFKAETVIARCCRALFEQTLNDIEYIFVNDCTPDNSVTIIEQVLVEYPQRRSCVKILHQLINQGVSAARQRGMENATGEFIIHCDSDDWPETNMYEKMYYKAISEASEVVCCGFSIEHRDYSCVTLFPESCIGHPSFNISPIEGAVWNKLIRRILIVDNDISFPEGVNLGEDCYVVTAARVLAKKESVIQEPLYHYNQMNNESITHNYNKQKFMEIVKWVGMFDDFLQKHNLKEKYQYELGYLKYQAKSFFLMFQEVRDIELWRSLFPEANMNIMRYNSQFYLKAASWFAAHKMVHLTKVILYAKDKIKNR